MPNTRNQSFNKLKAKYDEFHLPITAANALEGDAIWKESNLETFSKLSLPSSHRGDGSTTTCTTAQEEYHPNLCVYCFKSPLPNHLHQQCLDLFRENMKLHYENSSWGLDLDDKNGELTHDNARFLIVTATRTESTSQSSSSTDSNDNTNSIDTNEIVVAFTHFRFECSMEECNENNYQYDSSTTATSTLLPDLLHHEPILYVYEIQIHSKFQRQSLGKKLMMFMQIIGMKMKMKRLMLTVFKSNLKALSFYKNKLGYTVDESSPDVEDYEILSKSIQI